MSSVQTVGPLEEIAKPLPPKDEVGRVADDSKEFYAWSNIHFASDVDEGSKSITKRHIVEYGEKVSQASLKVSDADWVILVRERAVRRNVPPKTRNGEAPKSALIAKAARDMELALAGGE